MVVVFGGVVCMGGFGDVYEGLCGGVIVVDGCSGSVVGGEDVGVEVVFVVLGLMCGIMMMWVWLLRLGEVLLFFSVNILVWLL